ncbi:hypothetical protein V7056_18060 [Bacillus sp. JJ664]
MINKFLKMIILIVLLCSVTNYPKKDTTTAEAAVKVDINRTVTEGYKINHGYEYTYIDEKNQKNVLSPSSIGEYCTTFYNDRKCFLDYKMEDSYFISTNLSTKKKDYVINTSNKNETSLGYNGAPEKFYQLPMPLKKGKKYKSFRGNITLNNEVLSTISSLTLGKKKYSNVLVIKTTGGGKTIQSYYANDLGLLLIQDIKKKPFKSLFKLISYKKKSVSIKNRITSGYMLDDNFTYLYTSTDGDTEYRPITIDGFCKFIEDCDSYKNSFFKEGTSIFDIRTLPDAEDDERYYVYAFSTSNQKELAFTSDYTTLFKYSMPVDEGELYKNEDDYGKFTSQVLSTSYKLILNDKMYNNVMVVKVSYDDTGESFVFYLDKNVGLLMLELVDSEYYAMKLKSMTKIN